MKLEQMCLLMYADYLCLVWLLRYEADNIDPRQEIMNGSGDSNGSVLSLTVVVGYQPVTHIRI